MSFSERMKLVPEKQKQKILIQPYDTESLTKSKIHSMTIKQNMFLMFLDTALYQERIF